MVAGKSIVAQATAKLKDEAEWGQYTARMQETTSTAARPSNSRPKAKAKKQGQGDLKVVWTNADDVVLKLQGPSDNTCLVKLMSQPSQ